VIAVTRLIDRRSPILMSTYPLGAVELRNPRSDTAAEREAIRVSCMKLGDERPDECMRITSFVEATNHFEADRTAEERFEEALDVLATQNVFAHYGLLPSGCFYWPEAGRVLPRELGGRDRPGGISFRVPRDEFPRMDWPQFLLARKPNDLSQRLLRSYHWSHKAERVRLFDRENVI
jgi:hypothetical protein